MEEKNYLYIAADGFVDNIIVWNGVSEFQVPDGYSLVAVDTIPEGVHYNRNMYRKDDGLFYYKHTDGTFHLEPEVL